MKTRQLLIWTLIFSILLSFCACGDSALKLRCKNCDKEYGVGTVYCPACGKPIASVKPVCSKGHENEAEAKFCFICGETLESTNSNSNGSNNAVNGEQNENSQNGVQANNVWLKTKGGITGDSYANKYYYNYDGLLVAEELYYTSNNKTDTIYKYSYDEHGNVVLKNISYSLNNSLHSWTFTNKYDENGRLISVTNKFSEVTEYKYDANGVLTEKRVLSSGGNVTSREIYENGRIKTTYLEDDILYEEYFYDTKGCLDKYVFYVTLWCYESEEDGLISGYTEFSGKRDNAHEIPADTPAHVEIRENTTTYVYDANGNAVFERKTDHHGTTTESTYEYMSLADYRAQGLHNVSPTPTGDSVDGDNNNGGSVGGTANGGGTSGGTPCLYCKQSGRIDCYACDGTGREFKEFDRNGNKVTRTCTYRGCSNGKIKCPHCGGDGIYGSN